jgi:hypothetical protein
MKKRDHLGRPGHRWEKILKRILKKQDGKVWIGYVWFRIWTSDRLQWTQCQTFRFNRMQGISWLAECHFVRSESVVYSCYSTLQQNWQLYSMLTVYREVSQSWGNVQYRSYISSCPHCWGIVLCCIQGLWMDNIVFDSVAYLYQHALYYCFIVIIWFVLPYGYFLLV